MPRGTSKEVYNITPGGIREDVNPLTIPDGHLLSSLNWLTRRGTGRPRPGYAQVDTVLPAGDRIIGIGFRGSPLAGNNVILHTLTKAYFYNGSSTSEITGTWTTSTANDHVRFANYASSGTLYLTRINGTNAVDKWNGSGSFADIAAAPTGLDITSIGPYLMVARAGGDDYAVQWNNFNDIDDWPATNIARLVDTPGKVVAVRALSPLSVAVYKEDAVYLGTLQAAQTAFQFQLISPVSGPLSPAAVIAAQGAHYWMGENLSIYKFDGGQAGVFTAAAGSTLFNTFSPSNKAQTHGSLLDLDSTELWFWYTGNDTFNTRGLSVNIGTQAVNYHEFADSITASASWSKFSTLTIDGLTAYSDTINGLDNAFANIDAMSTPAQATMLLGSHISIFYRFGPYTTDDGLNFDWHFETGYRPVAGIDKRAEMDCVVSYWTANAGTSFPVTIEVTATDSAGEQDLPNTKVINLFTDSNHLLEFRGMRGKWIKMKHSGTQNLEGLEHRGAAILSWARAMDL